MKTSSLHFLRRFTGVLRRWRTLVPASVLLFPGIVRALNFTVSNLNDSGSGSLRGAIESAKSLVGAHTISFSVTGTITLTSGELVIDEDLTINGPGAASLIIARSDAAGTPKFRIFRVDGTSSTNRVICSISDLTIRNGHSVAAGGGIYAEFATLTVDSCTIADSFAEGTVSAGGGGIALEYGALTLRRSALLRNTAWKLTGGIPPYGGAVLIHIADGVLENCTFHGNKADIGAALAMIGDDVRVTACTFAGNEAYSPNTPYTTGVLYNRGTAASILRLENNLLDVTAGTVAADITNTGGGGSPQIISNGFNLCSQNAGVFNAPGDRRSVNPMLSPDGPQDHGGPTPTIALLPGSPAIDAGKAFSLTTDQRGHIRPRDFAQIDNAAGGDGADIGAWEADDIQQPGTALVVSTTDDHDDGVAGVLDCTLREAINRSNELAGGGSTITFAAGVSGTVVLDSQLSTLTITAPVTLAGPGARRLALSGETGVRPVMSFDAAGTGSMMVGLTIRNGQRPGAFVDGGGLVNAGGLTVTDCAFTGNEAVGFAATQPGQAGGRARGGAVFNSGTLALKRCTFTGNLTRGGAGANNSAQFGIGGAGGDALGGAVFNDAGGVLTASNCSFFTNSAAGGKGGNGPNFGGGNGGHGYGGIYNPGAATLTACTVTLNSATSGAGGTGNNTINNGSPGTAAGGLVSGTGTFTLRNTLCAANAGAAAPDVLGTFASGGYNLIGKNNGGAGFVATDQTGTVTAPLDAKLNPLPNHNGSTDTFLPLSNSPAVDKGKSFALDTDQRNLPRVRDDTAIANAANGDGTDIGAAELTPAYNGPPKFISITRIGPQVRLVVQGVPLVSYQLQNSAGVSAGFANYGAVQTTDGTGQTEFIDYGPLPARGFYRAMQSP